MLQVIGAGLPRTGTMSMKAALERLGFAPCYHMVEVFTHPEHVDRWLSVESDAPADWDHVMEGYAASVDWPASAYWRQLAQAYPEAKVVLTVRDPHRWYTSFRNLATRSDSMQEMMEEAPEDVRPLLNAMQRLRPLMDLKGQEIFGPDWRMGPGMAGEEEMVAAFHRYVETVRDALPPERLLVFDVREGWEPLCTFLGVEPPAGEPFPHLNDSESLERMFKQMMTEGRIALPTTTGAAE